MSFVISFFAICHLTFPQATAFLLLGFVSCASAGRIFILDDGEDDGEAFAQAILMYIYVIAFML